MVELLNIKYIRFDICDNLFLFLLYEEYNFCMINFFFLFVRFFFFVIVSSMFIVGDSLKKRKGNRLKIKNINFKVYLFFNNCM